MADKKIKLADLLKGTGFQEIPKDWHNQESPKRNASPDLVLPKGKEIILKADTDRTRKRISCKMVRRWWI